MRQYFIGLGTNIDPEKNMIKMIEGLFQWSEQVTVSKILRFAPVKMESNNYFLNTVVSIKTDASPIQLKKDLVEFETFLGRDQTDPNKKVKDRTADLDILFFLEENETSVDYELIPKEQYTQQPLLILLEHFGYKINYDGKNAPVGVAIFTHDQVIGTKVVKLI